jgi:hypothetical protein
MLRAWNLLLNNYVHVDTTWHIWLTTDNLSSGMWKPVWLARKRITEWNGIELATRQYAKVCMWELSHQWASQEASTCIKKKSDIYHFKLLSKSIANYFAVYVFALFKSKFCQSYNYWNKQNYTPCTLLFFFLITVCMWYANYIMHPLHIVNVWMLMDL